MEISAEELARLYRVIRGYEDLVAYLMDTSVLPILPLAELEKQAILQSLTRHPKSQQDMARELGVSERVMYYKLKQLGLCRRQRRVLAVLAEAS